MPDLHIIPGRHKSKVVFNAGTLDPSPLKTSQISLSHTPPTKQIQRSTMSLQEPVEYTREEMAQVLSRSEKIWSPFVPVTQQRHALPTSATDTRDAEKLPRRITEKGYPRKWRTFRVRSFQMGYHWI